MTSLHALQQRIRYLQLRYMTAKSDADILTILTEIIDTEDAIDVLRDDRKEE